MADEKISELPAAASVQADTIFPVTTDPAGTPETEGATGTQVANAVATLLNLLSLVPGARITLTPDSGTLIVAVDMTDGLTGGDTWNGGVADTDGLTINVNSGAKSGKLTINADGAGAAAEVEVNTKTLDLNMTGPATLDAVGLTITDTGTTTWNLLATALNSLFGFNFTGQMIVNGTAGSGGANGTTIKFVGAATNDDVIEDVQQSKKQTTDATPTNAYGYALSTSGSGVYLEVTAVGRRVSNGDISVLKVGGSFKNNAGTVSAVTGSPTALVTHEDNASTAIAFLISGTNIFVQVTGIAAATYNWAITVHAFPTVNS